MNRVFFHSLLFVPVLICLAPPGVDAQQKESEGWSPEAIAAMSDVRDGIPPSRVVDLEFHLADTTCTGDAARFPFLTWTAPGDDGNVGRATAYRIRYSTVPITKGSWSEAHTITPPPPAPAGRPDTCSLRMVPGGVPLWFAMEALDDVAHVGERSNTCEGFFSPLAGSFTDTVRAPSAVVWIAGHRLRGDRLVCQFVGGRFTIEDIELMRPSFDAVKTTRTGPDESMRHFPRIRGLVAGGAELDDAVTVYYQEVGDMHRKAVWLARTHGRETALSYLEHHYLVEWVSPSDSNSVQIELKGGPVKISMRLFPKSGLSTSTQSIDMQRYQAARRLTDRLHGCSWTGPPKVVVFVDHAGSFQDFGPADGKLADTQARHLLNGGSLDTLPKGPLRPDSRYLQDILENRAASSKP